MAAAAELASTPGAPSLAPIGLRVERGRLTLGRLRSRAEAARGGPVALVAGFGTACWLGPDAALAPGLGRLAHRATVVVDERGRVVLDRRARAYLAVGDPVDFEVVPVSAPSGLLLVPVEGFDRRVEGVAP